MLNKTRPNFNKFKNLLLRQRKKVEEELEAVENEDHTILDGLAEAADSGTDNWMAEAHGKTVAIRESLKDLLSRIQKSILKINKGKYGKCENCGKMIEAERLEAIPIATFCIACSKKATRD